MNFEPTEEQQAFAGALTSLLAGADVPGTIRSWAQDDLAAGSKLWNRLAELGLHGLCVPTSAGGLGADAVDMVIAFEVLGRFAVPGPYIESVVLAPALLVAAGDPHGVLAELADGGVATVAAPPMTPFALDADAADHVLLLDGTGLSHATPGDRLQSVDASRRLFRAVPGDAVASIDAADAAAALDRATLACAAQVLGAGQHLLEAAVEYAKVRRQFGRVIGEYQALKHALADVRVALDFARPLLLGAAVSVRDGSPDAARDVAAAKVACSVAADRAARTALQVHGAIGYTAEYDLGLWLTKVRALVGAWGDPSLQRGRVLAALVND